MPLSASAILEHISVKSNELRMFYLPKPSFRSTTLNQSQRRCKSCACNRLNFWLIFFILSTFFYIISVPYPSDRLSTIFPSPSCSVKLEQLRLPDDQKYKPSNPKNNQFSLNPSSQINLVKSTLCSKDNVKPTTLKVDLKKPPLSFEQLENIFTKESKDPVENGGRYPASCTPSQRLAVIIPYRDRAAHLPYLIQALHTVLRLQNQDYRVFLVEQVAGGQFNKGVIMNVAFTEALKLYNFTHVVFHDVDLIPEHAGNYYTAGDNPRHLSSEIDEFRYFLPYDSLFGGVVAFTTQQFVNVNGFSNMYQGWGGEDDDVAYRVLSAGYRIERPPRNRGLYKMIRHVKRSSANSRVPLLLSWKRWVKDGLNSLSTLKYSVVKIEFKTLYTRILVDPGHSTEDGNLNLMEFLKFAASFRKSEIATC